MRRVNVASVGCGWVADWHTRDGLVHIPEHYSIVACCDTEPAKAKEFAGRHKIPNAFVSFDDVLKRPDVDVVALCTPPSLHYDMVLAALNAAKHVVCEKPLTSSLALADAMIAAARKAKSRVMPVFQYRFGDGIAKVRHVIRS